MKNDEMKEIKDNFLSFEELPGYNEMLCHFATPLPEVSAL